MKILCDKHHQALWDSLVLLFENRLGHTLYHPWSLDWFPNQWAIARPYNNDIATAKQFLEGALPTDGTQQLSAHRGITFEEFKQTRFDVLIASYYDHIDIYLDLINKYQPQAKLVVHYGNEWPPHKQAKNYLCSTKRLDGVDGKHVVYYRQEFDTKLFRRPKTSVAEIVSLVNALPLNDLFQQDWHDFLEFEGEIGWPINCYSFGGGCRDGSLNYPGQTARRMRRSMFGLHLKTGGDGYGHVIHNWASCGRPIIYRSHQYRGKLASDLLEHDITGIDLDQTGIREGARKVRRLMLTNHEEYRYLSDNMLNRFNTLVDFDNEAQKVKVFMEELV